MSYSIEGVLYDTRTDALTALVANWVSAGGENGIDEIKSALSDEATPGELVRGWGDEFGFVAMGAGEDPADEREIAEHVLTHKADIILAT